MKFVYQFRTKDNQLHHGSISAPDRERAYRLLREGGIRPSLLEEAPGVLNKIFGKGKRWIAIGVLLVVLVSVVSSVAISSRRAQRRSMWTDRQQIYGDAGVIRKASEDGWTQVFSDVGDRYLARHAIPGVHCDCALKDFERREIAAALMRGRNLSVCPSADDLAEVALMKKIVNGMKRELCEYIADGGYVSGYMDRLDIRQKAEVGIYERVRKELHRAPDDEALWKKRNAELRAMGLPMVSLPEDERKTSRNEKTIYPLDRIRENMLSFRCQSPDKVLSVDLGRRKPSPSNEIRESAS